MADFAFEAWPTEHRVVTQMFGRNPSAYAAYGLPGHEGIDLRAPAGSAIYAVADGTVRAVHANLAHPYGLHVRIDHADGYQTIYAHLTRSMVAATCEARWRSSSSTARSIRHRRRTN